MFSPIKYICTSGTQWCTDSSRWPFFAIGFSVLWTQCSHDGGRKCASWYKINLVCYIKFCEFLQDFWIENHYIFTRRFMQGNRPRLRGQAWYIALHTSNDQDICLRSQGQGGRPGNPICLHYKPTPSRHNTANTIWMRYPLSRYMKHTRRFNHFFYITKLSRYMRGGVGWVFNMLIITSMRC